MNLKIGDILTINNVLFSVEIMEGDGFHKEERIVLQPFSINEQIKHKKGQDIEIKRSYGKEN